MESRVNQTESGCLKSNGGDEEVAHSIPSDIRPELHLDISRLRARRIESYHPANSIVGMDNDHPWPDIAGQARQLTQRS